MRFDRLIRFSAVMLLLVLALPQTPATVPGVMNYQGRLTDNSPQQNPIDATVQMDFHVYGSLLGNDLLWSETWPSVVVSNGIFTVLLGSNGSPLPDTLFNGDMRFLEIVVEGESLLPRQRLGSVAYAFEAERLAKICADGQLLRRVGDEWTCADLAVCTAGSFSSCYTGPSGTGGVGECRIGTTQCNMAGSGYDPCAGEVLPTAEVCGNGLDENCDGTSDEGCPCPGQQTNCGGICTDTQTDTGNCGSCGVVCDGGEVCVAGGCSGSTTFGGTVTNPNDPSQPGAGVPSLWSFAGQIGVAAGDAMCGSAGAHHICSYDEVQQAAAVGELNGLLQMEGLTFWVHRVATVVDVGGVQSPPGAGGRCNDWTYPTNHISDGEYASINGGTIRYFFDQDTTYTGNVADGHAGSGPNDGGPCGGAPPRAILCCNCPGGQTNCGGTCTDTQADPQNCGDCGIVCPGGQSCVAGICESGGPTFAGIVTSSADPTQPGPGIDAVWSYAGELGVAAGDAMCQQIGAGHTCTYAELLTAESAGELDALRQMQGLTFWVHRVTTVVDVNGSSSPPGTGGRCVDWTYPTNHIADGEYASVGGGTISYFFDQDTAYTGNAGDGHQGSGPFDGGPCGGAPPRALLCCY